MRLYLTPSRMLSGPHVIPLLSENHHEERVRLPHLLPAQQSLWEGSAGKYHTSAAVYLAVSSLLLEHPRCLSNLYESVPLATPWFLFVACSMLRSALDAGTKTC